MLSETWKDRWRHGLVTLPLTELSNNGECVHSPLCGEHILKEMSYRQTALDPSMIVPQMLSAYLRHHVTDYLGYETTDKEFGDFCCSPNFHCFLKIQCKMIALYGRLKKTLKCIWREKNYEEI